MSNVRERGEAFTPQGIFRLLIGLSTVALILFLVWYFSDVVIYILISAVLAIMFRPLVNLVDGLKVGRFKISRGVAALVTLLVIWTLFLVIFSLIVPLIFSQLRLLMNIDLSSVLSSIEEPVLYVQHYIQHLLSLPETNVDLGSSLVQWSKDFVNLDIVNVAFSSVVGAVVSSVISFFSISFITFFFLKEDELFFSMVTSVFPAKYSDNVTRALNSVTNLLSRYFMGLMLESMLIAFAVSVAMICWGMSARDGIFMGLIMGVLNVVPYAGPFIGACFAVFLGIVSPIEGMGVGHTVSVIVVSLMIIKGMDDFLLQPTLYSERVKAHPLEVFIVILLSGYVAGVVGMLLAIPSYTVLRVFGKEFFSQYSLVRKLTKEL